MSSPPPKRPRTDADNTNGNNISDAEKQEKETSCNDGGDSGSKKINLLDNTNIAVINPSILHQSISELANSYANATPYPHGMIHNFCKDGFLGE